MAASKVGLAKGSAENHDTILTRGLHRKVLNVNGKAVEVWITRSPGAVGKEPQDYVLFFVGKEDRVEQWVQIVADGWGKRPVEGWGMNHPGSGGSQGPTRLASVGLDAPTGRPGLDRQRSALPRAGGVRSLRR